MTQRDIDRAVATATGETVQSIADRGFCLLTAGPVEREHEPEPLDWDSLDHDRIGVLFPRRSTPAVAF